MDTAAHPHAPHGSHDHAHGQSHPGHRPAAPALGDSLMCASAGRRLAWAALPVGLTWALVAWALL